MNNKIVFDFILNKEDNNLLLECLNNDLNKLDKLIEDEILDKNRKEYIDSYKGLKKDDLYLFEHIIDCKPIDNIFHHNFEYVGEDYLLDKQNLFIIVSDMESDLQVDICFNFNNKPLVEYYKNKIELVKDLYKNKIKYSEEIG